MKQFIPTGVMLVATMLLVSLAIVYRTKLLSSYNLTRVSIPTVLRPVQISPVPASIRTDHYITPLQKNNSSSKKNQPAWRSDSFSDLLVDPEAMKKRSITNIRLPDIDP